MIRPSTLMRLIEDSALSIGSKIHELGVNTSFNIKHEYRARQLAKAKRITQQYADAIAEAEPHQFTELIDDLNLIRKRADELIAKRKS